MSSDSSIKNGPSIAAINYGPDAQKPVKINRLVAVGVPSAQVEIDPKLLSTPHGQLELKGSVAEIESINVLPGFKMEDSLQTGELTFDLFPYIRHDFIEPTVTQNGFAFDASTWTNQPVLTRSPTAVEGAPGEVVNFDGQTVKSNVMFDWKIENTPDLIPGLFEAVNRANQVASIFAGRPLSVGKNGVVGLVPLSFPELNAYYTPIDKDLHFGAHRFTDSDGNERLYLMAGDPDVVFHEYGHAVHHALKPNEKGYLSKVDGYGTWGESFGDQLAMWGQLQNDEYVDALIKSYVDKPSFDLKQSNMLSMLSEGLVPVIGEPIRDAVNHAGLNELSGQVHDSSSALTGAVYNVFVRLVDRFSGGSQDPAQLKSAMRRAATMMGILQHRATDFTPEDFIRIEDVARGMLTAYDTGFFEGEPNRAVKESDEVRQILVEELSNRGLLTDASLTDYNVRRNEIAKLSPIEGAVNEAAIEDHIVGKIAALESMLGREVEGRHGFSLRPKSIVRDGDGNFIARFGLAREMRGTDVEIANHGVVVVSPTGKIIDLHSPWPPGMAQDIAKARKTAAEKLDRANDLMQSEVFATGMSQATMQENGKPLFQVTLVPDGDATTSTDLKPGQKPVKSGFDVNYFYLGLHATAAKSGEKSKRDEPSAFSVSLRQMESQAKTAAALAKSSGIKAKPQPLKLDRTPLPGAGDNHYVGDGHNH